jgi:hypothetical protein
MRSVHGVLAAFFPSRNWARVETPMIERDIALKSAGATVAGGAQSAGDRGKGGNVLSVVPFVELVLTLGRHTHCVQKHRRSLSGHTAHSAESDPLEPRHYLDARGHALLTKPTDCRFPLHDCRLLAKPRFTEHRRSRAHKLRPNLWVVHANPTFPGKKTWDALSLGDVFGIIPIMELVLCNAREVDYRDQDTLCHGSSPLIYGIIAESSCGFSRK